MMMKKLLFKISLLLLGVAFLSSSCKKDDNRSDETIFLTTKWIEMTKREDILFFRNDFLNLNRGKEVNSAGEIIRPKLGSGPYMYKLKGDSISLMYSLSSMYQYKSYKYKIENGRLHIGDFYEKSSNIIVFEKFD